MNMNFQTILILLFLNQFVLVISVAHNQQSLRGRQNTIINSSDQSSSPNASASVTTILQDENHESSSSIILSVIQPKARKTPMIDIPTTNNPSSAPMSNPPTHLRSVTESSISHAISSVSFLGFDAYPICNICREGSRLQIPDQVFRLQDNSNTGEKGLEMRCDTAYYAGLSGMLSPEFCLLSKRRCDCLRQELNQWPELVGLTVDEAKIQINEEFQGIKEVTFNILQDDSEDNAVSSAITIKDRVEFHAQMNGDGNYIVSSIPTCYCSDDQERGRSYNRDPFGGR